MIKIFVFNMVVGSTLMCVESKGWWEYWIFLEINSLAFIIFMFKEKKKEKIFVFLLFQTLASTLMMTFIFLNSWATEQNMGMNIFYLMMISVFMKIGMFPFHSWIVKTMKNFSWVVLMVVFSWQKLIPLFIVIKTMEKTKMIVKFSILSALVLNFFLMKMNNSKKIMTLSSLTHNTWMFMPLMVLKEISLAYLITYSMMVIPLMMNFSKENMKSVNKQMFSKKINKEVKFMLFSISGIPPSMGFLMKMLVLSMVMMLPKKSIEMTILLITSCVAFLVYCHMFTKYFFLEKSKKTIKNYFYVNSVKEISWVFITLPVLMWN